MNEPKNNKEALSEYVKCRHDPAYFLNSYAAITHPTRGIIPFDLWDFQSRCIEEFIRYRFNVILKSRQMGISTLTAGYIAWMMRFYKDKNILIVATKAGVAKNIIAKIKIIYSNLPDFLRPELATDNQQEVKLANGSLCKAVPTSEDAGRSEALSLLVIDEAAFVKWANKIWTAAYPTLATGGSAIVLSTPNGVGNFFHKCYSEAERKKNDFNPIKLPWYLHPERNQSWFDSETENMSNKEIAQEYECDFISSGDTVIDPIDLKFYSDNHVLEPIEKTNFDDNLWIWRNCEPGRKYIISADVARGDGKDFSACHVIDLESYEQVAEYQGHLQPDEFGYLLTNIGYNYNDALIVCENNSVGYATLQKIIDLKYPNVYYSSKDHRPYVDLRSGASHFNSSNQVLGFQTTARTRPLIISRLEEDVRNKDIIIRSSRLVDELRTFVFIAGRPQAMHSYCDDLVMSIAIGTYIRATSLKLFNANNFVSKIMMNSIERNTREIQEVIPDLASKANSSNTSYEDYSKNIYNTEVKPGDIENMEWLL